MAKRRKGYSEEFRQQMVRLVRSGRTPEDLGREFEPSAQAIRNWVVQAELDEGTRSDGLKTENGLLRAWMGAHAEKYSFRAE